jgi:two-component system, LytTR family, response regulator LytT
MHVVILEDEAMVAQRLARLTREILGEELASIRCVADLESAATHLTGRRDALLLLDLNLAGQDGFDVLRRALVEPFQTVVVSANTSRAIEAFELGVVDFVAKPFTVARLTKAFERIRHGTRQARARFLAVSIANKVELIPVESVLAIHGDDDYSSIEALDGRKHLHKKTLSALECVLPPGFQRVHRSHIVNMSHVARILTRDGGTRTIVLTNGTQVPVSRSYVKTLNADLIQ